MSHPTFENPFDLDSYYTVAREIIERARAIENLDRGDATALEALEVYMTKTRQNWIAVDLKSNESYMETLWNDVLNTRAIGDEQPFDGAGYAAKQLHRAAGLRSAESVMIDLVQESADDFDRNNFVDAEKKFLEAAVLMDMAAYAPRLFCMVYNGVGDFDYGTLSETFAHFRKELRHLAACYLGWMDRVKAHKYPSVNTNVAPEARWMYDFAFSKHNTTESFYLEKLVDLADLNYARITQGAQPL